MSPKQRFIHTFLSVDCVVFGFDNKQLNILLVSRGNIDANEHKVLKLPGSLIYGDEDVDDAAVRVLYELTGIRQLTLKQFKCFASPDRANHPDDVKWLSKEYQSGINRLITVTYLAICKIDREFHASKYDSVRWCPVDQIPDMPFDHNLIAQESLNEMRNWIDMNPLIAFELLPSRFTLSQLHRLYEEISGRTIDIRNFHKKVAATQYIVALDEKQKSVPHRAARYYKFDKRMYNTLTKSI